MTDISNYFKGIDSVQKEETKDCSDDYFSFMDIGEFQIDKDLLRINETSHKRNEYRKQLSTQLLQAS